MLDVGLNITLQVGDTITRPASFSDPDDTAWSATIDYGDGPTEPLALDGKNFVLTHTYTSPGQFTVVAIVRDSQYGTGYGAFGVTVQGTHAPKQSKPEPPSIYPVVESVFRLLPVVQSIANGTDLSPPARERGLKQAIVGNGDRSVPAASLVVPGVAAGPVFHRMHRLRGHHGHR